MWNERYSAPDYVYGTEPNAFLASVADRIPPGPVLCLAEGEGRNAVYLASRGHEVEAVDASAVGLEKARRLASQRRVEIKTTVADLADYPIGDARWAAVVSIFCHLPAALRHPLHRAVVRGLRPGGVLLLEAYAPAQLGYRTGGPPVRELLYTLDELRDDFAGLDLVQAVERVRPVNEGRFHTGDGAVVQLVGVKPEAAGEAGRSAG